MKSAANLSDVAGSSTSSRCSIWSARARSPEARAPAKDAQWEGLMKSVYSGI